MKLTIDTDAKILQMEHGSQQEEIPLYSGRAFHLLSREWVRVGWNQKYSYTFTWMGLPIIQLPEDMVRMQEVLWRVQPDVIIETGVAHGGGVIFYASLCKAWGKGRVIGIDIEYRSDHRQNVENHVLADFITLLEGSSTDPGMLAHIRSLIQPGETVFVILDSNHSRRHVAEELEAYSPLVTLDSYVVATDGVMEMLHDVPRGKPEWKEDNPAAAARAFLTQHPSFVLDAPQSVFNEGDLHTDILTHWPDAWLKRVA